VTLNQALATIKSRKDNGGKKSVHFLACGFEPLHLKTFLQAALLERLPQDDIEVRNGVYGDLAGNLGLASESDALGAAVLVEWSDIDPRLSLRSSGGWSGDVKADILFSTQQRYSYLEAAIGKLGARMPVVVAPPSLPLMPIGNTVPMQSSLLELELEQQLASFLLRIASHPGIRVAHPAGPEFFPSLDERLDAKMEFLAGFPYTIPFAAALAQLLVNVLYQPTPKKGLITDLDETLWAGIVGEVGPENVSWDQEHHTQVHGLYQQMLGHLGSCGVLLGVCSKNETSTVEAALGRKDLFLKAESLFPVHANWGPKSQSVAKVLRAWNIHEDSVVFVDDNPMELEEVKQAFPAITCLQFSGKDPAKVWRLLGELRSLFGKPFLTDEDRLRQASIRASAQIQDMGALAGSPEFLKTLEGSITLDWSAVPTDKRPLELVNKTNQFNLNGIRISEGEWHRRLEDHNTLLAVVSYEDKFGPLGKIAVLVGSREGSRVKVSNWVMSCRAFSRRLEHHTLDSLFRYAGAEEIEFAFQATDRNQPTQEFLRFLGIGSDAEGVYRLSRQAFLSQCGELPHQVLDLTTK
jgi:FkbH-like protein